MSSPSHAGANELLERLSLQKQRSEASGAVFQAEAKTSEADTVWDQHHENQFTPKGKSRLPSSSNPPQQKDEDSESNSTLSVEAGDVAEALALILEAQAEAAAEAAKASAVAALQAVAEAAARAESQGALPNHREVFDTAQLDMTMAAHSLTTQKKEDDPPTQPASPSLAARSPLELPDALHLESSAPDESVQFFSEPASSLNVGAGLPCKAADSPQERGSRQAVVSREGPALAPLAQPQEDFSIVANVAPVEDVLSMSSNSYFKPYRQRNPQEGSGDKGQEKLLDTSKELPLEVQWQQQQQLLQYEKIMQLKSIQQQQPFPRARHVVVQSRLEEVEAEVKQLAAATKQFIDFSTCTEAEQQQARSVHPTELQRLLELADAIKVRSKLGDADLEECGWPTAALRQIRDIVDALTRWQQCEDATKQAIGGNTLQPGYLLSEVVGVLEHIFTSWRDLTILASINSGSSKTGNSQSRIRVDLGLQRRAKAAAPLVSALIDQAVAMARRHTDLVAVRRLEALFTWQVELGPTAASVELGVAQLLEQTLRELRELSPSRHNASSSPSSGQVFENASPDPKLSAPEILWQAVVNGDALTVESIIRQGGLVSGRTQDSNGHSVLWNAVAFQRTEVALLLLRHFPPDMLHGVQLGELHHRNGNSLLHVVSAFQPFTSQAQGLFAVLFERMPEALRSHRNVRGQTLLHVAAGRLNFWILRFACTRLPPSYFTLSDSAGRSSRDLLKLHLAAKHCTPRIPEWERERYASLPAWCPLGIFQPPLVGMPPPPFSDLVVKIHDKAKGIVEVHGHQIILAANSIFCDHELRKIRSKPTTSQNAVVLELPASVCSDSEVAIFALRYLYKGDISPCSFSNDTDRLYSLLQLISHFGLPPPLKVWALHSLFKCLSEGDQSSGPFSDLLLQADELGLPHEIRVFLSHRVISCDAVWDSLDQSQAALIDLALAELELSRR